MIRITDHRTGAEHDRDLDWASFANAQMRAAAYVLVCTAGHRGLLRRLRRDRVLLRLVWLTIGIYVGLALEGLA